MLQSRYFYLLVYLHFVVCTVLFTPKLLYAERYAGSVASLAAAALLACVMMIALERQMGRFAGEPIERIMDGAVAGGLRKALFLGYFLLLYGIGLNFLLAISHLAHKFISANLSTGLLFALFLLLATAAALLDAKSLFFMLAIVALFHIPFSVLILLLCAFDSSIRFDFIVDSASYINHWPSYPMIAAGAFFLNGYMGRILFNEHLARGNPRRQHVILFALGLLLLAAFYFIPFGYVGLAGIGYDNDVWFTVANSLNLPYFFIERFLVVFLMAQLGVTLMFVILIWHAALRLLRLAVPAAKGGNYRWISGLLLVALSLLLGWLLDDETIRDGFGWLADIKLIFDLTMIGAVAWCARRRHAAA